MSLSLTGRQVVVAGGGRVATRRVADLVEAGASVTVVAPQLSSEIEDWVEQGRVTAARRSFQPDDLDGAWFVVAATDNPEVNRAVASAGEERRCFVSVAQGPPGSTARPLSVMRRGALEVAVGTSGRSPALAAWLRRRLEATVGPEYGVLLELAAEAREELRGSGRAVRRSEWCEAFDSGILDLIRTGQLHQAREGLRTCLLSSSG